jgi:hypothetical protein
MTSERVRNHLRELTRLGASGGGAGSVSVGLRGAGGGSRGAVDSLKTAQV